MKIKFVPPIVLILAIALLQGCVLKAGYGKTTREMVVELQAGHTDLAIVVNNEFQNPQSNMVLENAKTNLTKYQESLKEKAGLFNIKAIIGIGKTLLDAFISPGGAAGGIGALALSWLSVFLNRKRKEAVVKAKAYKGAAYAAAKEKERDKAEQIIKDVST